MPLTKTVASGAGQVLQDGFLFQSAIFDATAAPIAAPKDGDPVALFTRHGRPKRISAQVVVGGAPAPGNLDIDVLGSLDGGVTYTKLLGKFAVAQSDSLVGLVAEGITHVKSTCNALDQGTATVLFVED